MILATGMPQRLVKSVLLRDTPIYQETFTVDTQYNPDQQTSGLYTHDMTEIGFVVEGNGVHRILNQSVPCKAGDIYIVHENTLHGYFTAEGERLRVRRLCFSVNDWFDGEVAEYCNPRFCYGVFTDSPIAACAMLNARTQTEINGLYNAIALELNGKRPEWKAAVGSHLSMLLITLSRYVGGAIKNLPDVPSKEWLTVSTVIRMVDDDFGDCELTLESIAASLYISKSYLSKLFKRFTGQAFTDYIKAVRYDNASRLLKETEMTVEEIANYCGLRDIPSFYHSFSTAHGMTPNQYRLENKTKYNIKKGDIIMTIIEEISENLQKGKAKVVKELVQKALDEGASVEKILNDGLLAGMTVIGEKFKNNEVYVPEVLVAARAMNMGTQILKPYLAENGIVAAGKICIGTVQGDLHDIGKNLVKMMMEGKGLEVVDLGTDVSPETFVRTAIEEHCQVICCSALLTTTMGVMEEVVKEAERLGVRDKLSIMVGGAPVNEDFCRKIGADAYTVDAASAADKAVELCKKNA